MDAKGAEDGPYTTPPGTDPMVNNKGDSVGALTVAVNV